MRPIQMLQPQTLLLTLWLCLIGAVKADDTEYYLVTDLFRNYDKRLRPSLNHTEVLNMTFAMALNQIMEVDERNQILVTNSWINLGWVDVRLRWSPAAHRGIEEIRLPISTIWTPDIILYNNADPMSHVSTVSTNAIIRYDGNITWLSTAILKSSCSISVRDFPFDIQECSMQFASWTYGGRQIDLTQVSEEGDISVYKLNTEWQLMSFTSKRNLNNYSCCPEPWPDITYYIRIERRPLFYVFNLILPCILITIVALFSFLVPCDSGEKLTTTITTLLSMTVFLLLVTEQLPPSAIALPLIGVYYGITMAIVSAATMATVITLNIYYKTDADTEVPRCVKTFCFKFLAPIFFINVSAELLYDPNNSKSNSHTHSRAHAGRCRKLDDKSFLEMVNNSRCGSPHCPCTLQGLQNGSCGLHSPPSFANNTNAAAPLLCCPHEYKPCTPRAPPFCSNPLSPHDLAATYDHSSANANANAIAKDTPSVHRYESLLRTGAFGPSSPPSALDGVDHDANIGVNNNMNISADLRNIIAQKYYSQNQQFARAAAAAFAETGSDRTDIRTGSRSTELSEVLERLGRGLELQEQQTIIRDRQTRVRNEWRLLAVIVDRCFFWLFIGVTSVITGILFNQARCSVHT